MGERGSRILEVRNSYTILVRKHEVNRLIGDIDIDWRIIWNSNKYDTKMWSGCSWLSVVENSACSKYCKWSSVKGRESPYRMSSCPLKILLLEVTEFVSYSVFITVRFSHIRRVRFTEERPLSSLSPFVPWSVHTKQLDGRSRIYVTLDTGAFKIFNHIGRFNSDFTWRPTDISVRISLYLSGQKNFQRNM
jgi:hypothetical protein